MILPASIDFERETYVCLHTESADTHTHEILLRHDVSLCGVTYKQEPEQTKEHTELVTSSHLVGSFFTEPDLAQKGN